MKTLFILLTLFLLPVLLKAQDPVGANKQERKVLTLINSLPEVQQENNFRKKHKVKHLLRAYIQNTPTAQKNYYSVSIGEEKGDRMFTYEWYEVDAKTFSIRYWDIASDKTMTLSEMRRFKKKRS